MNMSTQKNAKEQPKKAQDLFYTPFDLEESALQKLVNQSTQKADFGELYMESSLSQSMSLEGGVIRSAASSISQGFGLRAVLGDRVAYAHSSQLEMPAILKAKDEIISAIQTGHEGTVDINPSKEIASRDRDRERISLYGDVDPTQGVSQKQRSDILRNIDTYLRDKDARVQEVLASLSASWKKVLILKSNGQIATDIRPLVGLRVTVLLEDKGKREGGSDGRGQRTSLDLMIQKDTWQSVADEALRRAQLNLVAKPAPQGAMPIVLANGWNGVLFHEAVGHGLEADANYKKTSVYHNKLGQQVAPKGVTLVDDGTLAQRRGSLQMDDEGNPSERNVLIEDGILVKYMQDEKHARLMDVAPTGNGRRESYSSPPIPRMMNTFLEAGKHTPEDILTSLDEGLYVVGMSGGQVDTTSGKFVFEVSEAYQVNKGKVSHPVKDAILIGDGPTVLSQIEMVGNDLTFDPGIGTCGKQSQWVPVGVGQPTLKIKSLTVGGTG